MSDKEQENKHGIDETMDVLEYLDAVSVELQKHKADDGKIDAGEIRETAISTMREGWSAAWGASDIPLEMGDRSPEETKQLLDKALPILKRLAETFSPV